MPASSLIFVVIVAIWAVYLLQHWSRRREHGAAARSVDGYTEAMRVLEKRRVLPSADLAEPRPHSYSVMPARTVRATVDVKRAVPAGASRRRSPLVARRSSQVDHSRSDDQREVDSMSTARDRRPGAPRPVSRAQRLLRAALLLVSVLWVPVSVALAITGVLLWASVPLSVLTVVAVLVWLRTEARADRVRNAGGRRATPTTRPASEPRLSSDDTQVIREPQRYAVTAASPAAASATPPAAAAQPIATSEPATSGARGPAAASSAAYDMVFDVEATGVAPQKTSEPPAPGTWSPVPVPTPTYAMKAKAEPRYTEDGIPADVFDTPEFADEVDELDERALFARRAASQ
ncbi:MAG TPA: hypothetical protein VFG98_10540 [Intrasporangium sp.]|nr:hypothetical protein [Intrasporangium sp.]